MNVRILARVDRDANEIVRWMSATDPGTCLSTLETIESLSRFRVRRITGEDGAKLPFRFVQQARLLVGLGEKKAGRDGIAAPDRNLQSVDRLPQSPAPKVDTPKEQMRLVIIRRQIHS